MDAIRYLVVDIETVADGRLVQKLRYPEEPELSPAKAIAQYREELRAESEGKSDFIPYTFHVPVSVAIAGVRADYTLAGLGTLDRGAFRPQVITRRFWEAWLKRQEPTLVTFNGRGFDLPVLELCAFRYGISVPRWFSQQGSTYTQPRNRYNTNSHFDLIDFLSAFGATRINGGLNLCAALLNKPGKMETKGAMVQDLWEKGEHLRIDDYCLCDVLDTYFVFLRTQLLQGKITLEEEHRLVESAKAQIEISLAEYPSLSEYLAKFRFWSKPLDSDSGFLVS